MLHEVLLSLAGHPSPLLRSDPSAANADKHPAAGDATTASAVFTPPERELLASVSHLSGLHIKLRSHTAQIAVSHPSTICRAVAASISSVHLAAFQRKVLEVEDSVLRRDASLVGAYNIVPLTAVVGEFSDWTRRMEWLWEIVKFMLSGSTEIKAGKQRGTAEGATASLTASPCTGASIIDKLRGELQTGYLDIETTAASLVAVAETAWLKQVSAWILYGRLPTFGSGDFFVQRASEDSDEVGQDGVGLSGMKIYRLGSKRRKTNIAGLRLRTHPAPIICHAVNSIIDALYWPIVESDSGKKDGHLWVKLARHSSTVVAAFRTFQTPIPSRQCCTFTDHHRHKTVSVEEYSSEIFATGQGS